jgi:hypothetical protein
MATLPQPWQTYFIADSFPLHICAAFTLGAPQKLHFVTSPQGLHKCPGSFATAPQFLHVYAICSSPFSIQLLGQYGYETEKVKNGSPRSCDLRNASHWVKLPAARSPSGRTVQSSEVKKKMKIFRRPLRGVFPFLVGLACLWAVSPLHAKPKITTHEIKEVAKHQMLVTFSWHVDIQSDKAWDGCDLKISFRDSKGEEIYTVKETIVLKVGQNAFSGTEVCQADIWKRVVKYVTTLDCVFQKPE